MVEERRQPENQYVTHAEFNQFRSEIFSSFDRVFSKIDRLGDRMNSGQRTQWSPIVTFIGVVVSVVLLALTGYIAHIKDGHPHRVEDKVTALTKELASAEATLRREMILRDEITRLKSQLPETRDGLAP